jgi:histidinol-phosphatase (PHP family)
MIANYHTHTWRCRHAYGTEREYVENAIEAGLKILGFSDHTPQVYPDGYICPVKMLPQELEGYVDTVLDLKREYRADIEILLGLEAEYLDTLWEPLMRLLEPYPIEYLILGQHYLGNGIRQPFCGERTDSVKRLKTYCKQTREALETGKFLYFAHPDVLWFTGPDDIYEEEMTGLCKYCKDAGIPLEINLLGLREDRNYPDERFWKIAAREGNTVVYGSDAHRPDHVYSPEVIAKADRFLLKTGIGKERLLEVLRI